VRRKEDPLTPSASRAGMPMWSIRIINSRGAISTASFIPGHVPLAIAVRLENGLLLNHGVGVQLSSWINSLYQLVSQVLPLSVENACSHFATTFEPLGFIVQV
jgi:hypothetical protein